VSELRKLAFAIAYRMLGSVAEAEDVAQEALLRLHDAAGVRNEEAFVTTVTTRLALDVLRSARKRRESYTGSWLPEPLVDAEAPARVEDEENVSLAFLVLLERLTPDERAVLVLREAFDLGFPEIAETIRKSQAACRQLLSRARRRIDAGRPRFDADRAERDALARRFLAAARDGDIDGLVALLAPDAMLVGDGGGKARAILKPMTGAAKVARALFAFYGRSTTLGIELLPAQVNGQPGVRVLDPYGRLVNVVGLDIAGGRITTVRSIVNPDKLVHLGPVSDLALR
jgi:RNA polymerase sigma-70 factor, ECF subfamily